MTRPRPAVVVLLISAIALITGVTIIASAGSGSSIASVGQRPPMPTDTPADPPSSTATGSTAVTLAPVSSRIRSDATVLPRRDPTAIPRQIRIPSLGIDAPVDEVGLLGDGLVEVPRDVSRTGWYRYSQVAGSQEGSTVIVGHKDGVDQGRGAFYSLDALTLDDIVVVETDAGERLRYRVVARESFDKQVVPLADLFSGAGSHRLTLITCGGPFDATTLGYTDNVVVTAVLLNETMGSDGSGDASR